MGYTKKWVPPTIPLRDNLAAWKTLFGDLHQNLLDAGLVQSATSGQLDISAVSVLPADGSFEGFIEYELDDALQSTAPVVIKLEFGCGSEGLGQGNNNYVRSRTPRIRCSVYYLGVIVHTFQCPQGYNLLSGIHASQLTAAGGSTICYSPENGFLGVVYGAGSRNKPFANNSGAYYGATFALFVQRILDNSGTPTTDLAVYAPNLANVQSVSGLWDSGVLQQANSVVCTSGGAPITRNDMAPRVGRENFSAGANDVLLEPINYPSTPPKPFPYIVSYRHTDIGQGEEFEFQPLIGPPRNFIALGRETSMSIDLVDGQHAGIAMLFE